jgi:hypothetical protein
MSLEKTANGLKLIAVAARLREIEAERVAGRIKPVPAGALREKVLCDGIMTLALAFGVTLKPIHAINSLGAIDCIARGEPLGRGGRAVFQ